MQRHGRYIPSQLKFLWDQGKGFKKKKEQNKEQSEMVLQQEDSTEIDIMKC